MRCNNLVVILQPCAQSKLASVGAKPTLQQLNAKLRHNHAPVYPSNLPMRMGKVLTKENEKKRRGGSLNGHE